MKSLGIIILFVLFAFIGGHYLGYSYLGDSLHQNQKFEEVITTQTIVNEIREVMIPRSDWEDIIRTDDDSRFDRHGNLIVSEGATIFDLEGNRLGIIKEGEVTPDETALSPKKFDEVPTF